MTGQPRVHLEFAHSLDTERWPAWHAAGLVPDRLPYGLDRLAGHDFELSVRPPVRSRALLRLNAAARRATGGSELVTALCHRERRACDLAVCWDERTGIPAAVRSRFPGEPPAATGVIWLTEPGMRSNRGWRVSARGLASAALVWANTHAQLESLDREWRIPESRVRLVPVGIDPGFWRTDGVRPEPMLVVGAGNDRHRDHRQLVDSMLVLRGRVPSVRLELATHHPVSIPRELGLRHPHLTHVEMRQLYGRASVVAVATQANRHLCGISVLLEAMSCERPVVTSDTAGMREYITDGETGLLVPSGDRDALAGACESLLRDPERAREIGRAGRRSIETNFSTAILASNLAQALRETLSRPRA